MVRVVRGLPGDLPVAQGFEVRQRPRGAGMDTLAAERALRILQDPVELHRDPGFEPPIPDGDGEVPLLLGADPHAPITGDAVVVVPQYEGIRIIRAALPGAFPAKRPVRAWYRSTSVDSSWEAYPERGSTSISRFSDATISRRTFRCFSSRLLFRGHHHSGLGFGGAGGHGLAHPSTSTTQRRHPPNASSRES